MGFCDYFMTTPGPCIAYNIQTEIYSLCGIVSLCTIQSLIVFVMKRVKYLLCASGSIISLCVYTNKIHIRDESHCLERIIIVDQLILVFTRTCGLDQNTL